MREIGVGLLGLGNVGAGVVKLLEDNAPAIEARLGARIVVRAIAVRDSNKDRLIAIDPSLLTTDLNAVIRHPDVDIVAELIGGQDQARDAVLRAISGKKHVVTANKAVLAVHGEEIYAAAHAAGLDLYYEAAVCGGVPVIRMLREGLASDRVEAIHGIVNGTSNFILSTMSEGKVSFAQALADAQDRGFAEADPELDISGVDAAHKLAILIRLCFCTRVNVDDIFVEGITGLDSIDFDYAARFGYVIKPLAIAREHEDGIQARVHPAMLPNAWLLAAVPGAKNALYVNSYALGSSMYYGAGAGMMPTAMAVVSDIIEVARNMFTRDAGGLPWRNAPTLEQIPLLSIDTLISRYYMRFSVLDRPGVLGRLTTVLGEHDISIAQVVQEGPRDPGRPVRVVVVSHKARERDMRLALAEIDIMDVVVEPTVVVRIL